MSPTWSVLDEAAQKNGMTEAVDADGAAGAAAFCAIAPEETFTSARLGSIPPDRRGHTERFLWYSWPYVATCRLMLATGGAISP